MLRQKRFLTYFFICAVPLLLLAALNYWNATHSVAKSVDAIVENDLRAFTTAVNKLLEDQESSLLKLATAPVFRVPSEAPAGEIVGVTPSPDVLLLKKFDIYSRRGNLLTSAPPPVPDDRVWTAQATVVLERLLDDGSLSFSVPIHDARGLEVERAIVGIVDLQKVFSTAALAFESGSGGSNTAGPRIMVHDGSGKPIYQSDSSATMGLGATASAPLRSTR